MSIKLDMSKAYDRVSWDFLEQVMIKMGFDNKIVKLIVCYIKSIIFSVLINEKPHGNITPSKRFRQGDPLLPFIFLFCIEGLITLLNMAEEERYKWGERLIDKPAFALGQLVNHDKTSMIFSKSIPIEL